MPESHSLILGVDGGGTKTSARLALVRAGQCEPLGRGLAGPSNPRAAGIETATANLEQAIAAAWADAGRQSQRLAAAVLAIAGTSHRAMAEQVLGWAEKIQLADSVQLVHDADAVLAAGADEGWGVALIVGTGSAAIGVARDGRRHVAGGWGYWFGDEGSGYWIGREALRGAAQAADGRAAPAPLYDAVQRSLDVDDPRAMLAALGESGDVRRCIAELAATVCRAAEQGDAAATAILDRAAEELAELVAVAAAKTDLGVRFPLALAGGVGCGSPLLREMLARRLEARGLAADPLRTVPEPDWGCVQIAARQLADRSGD
jgi:N-acetylglucosamine kinase-like BadF-type ATPase